jgi:PAS domain S-box-containing protein
MSTTSAFKASSSVPRSARLDLWLPFVVLVLALALTADAWRHARSRAEQALEADFQARARSRARLIEQRLASYQEVLRGVGGLFAAAPGVTAPAFHDYMSMLRLRESHAGMRALGYAAWLPSTAETAASGGSAPLMFGDTFSGDTPLQPGYDILSDMAQRAAAEHARDSGGAVIAASRTQSALMMYLPVYDKTMPRHDVEQHRRHLRGWVAAAVAIPDLVAPPARELAPQLGIEVYDGDTAAATALLFAQAPAVSGRYHSAIHLNAADRTWTVVLRSPPGFQARLDSSASVIAWLGTGVSLLLALVTWLLMNSRMRTLQLSWTMNRMLLERDRRYREIFENSASIAFVLDPADGRIVDANLAAEAFWGRPLASLRRTSIADIDLAADEGMHGLLRGIKPGKAWRLECRHRLADGSVRDVELHASALMRRDKLLVFATLYDMTARKQAEQALRASEARYRAIAENTSDVIWMMDADTLGFTYISPSIERQRGYTPEEIMARHSNVAGATSSALAPAMPQAAQHLHERIRRFRDGDESKRRDVFEMEQPHKDGYMVPVEVVSTLLCDEAGVPRAVIGVSRDISARRQAQEEQKRFVAMVSHEFRTPLATIDGAVQRLKATANHADTATRNRYTKIQNAVDRLTGLLDAYLTQDSISMVGQRLHLSMASPLALLNDTAECARALSQEHAITVEAPHAPDDFVCDIDRMRLTLRMLADNAVKYTPPGSHILLQAHAAPRGGVEFVVADNGVGIPENELPLLFKRYFRGRRAQWQSGSGLGLDMARTVVKLHGGTLQVRNRPEGGAEFTIWLPDTAAAERM